MKQIPITDQGDGRSFRNLSSLKKTETDIQDESSVEV